MGRLRSWLRLAALLLCGLSPALAQASDVVATDAEAVAAYRAGDLESARSLWLEALEGAGQELPAAERARLCYNLGTLAARQDEPLEAVAWHSAALRLRPRDDDTWANLELARLEAGLEAADRGDLKATLERLLSAWTPGESAWLALFGLLPLAVALGLEALRGGRRWRWLSFAAAVLALLCALPWARHRLRSADEPLMVVASESVGVFAEPRSDAQRIDELAPGDEVRRLDLLPEWSEIDLGGRRRGWLRSSAIFELRR